MYVTSFWFHSKLKLEKAKKPASCELAIHAVLFLNILHNRVLDVFKWTFWQTSFHQVFYSSNGVLYLRSFMSNKTSLLTSTPENFSPYDSGFYFHFDLAFSHGNVLLEGCYLQWENVC